MDRVGLETAVKEFDVTRSHGQNLGVIMGDLLFDNTGTCLRELVANSYDADAPRVDITYEPESDLLVISDNGTGMDEVGLENFYRLGDSVKLKEIASDKGRRRIGKFGIATLVLRRLGGQYKLETIKDEVQLTTEEHFTRDDKDSKAIKVKREKAPSNRQGTTITIEKLQFTPTDSRFDLEGFKRSLAVEMPLSSEFTVYVNGQQVAPDEFRTATEYLVEIDDRQLGKVMGSIFYSRKSLSQHEAGIFVKVHGRAVGGSSLKHYSGSFRAGLERRVHGVINADGLSDLVGFDRSRFVEHPKVTRLFRHLREVLNEIDNDMDIDVKSQTRDQLREDVIAIAETTGRKIGRAFRTEPYQIVFDSTKAGSVASLDKERRILYVNSKSTVVRVTSQNKIGIERALVTAAYHATARSLIADDEKRKEYDESATRLAENIGYSKGRSDLSELLAESEEDLPLRKRASKSRLYNYKDVARLSGLGNAVIKRAVTAGVLHDRGGERIKGEEIVAIGDHLKGKVTLYDGVKEAIPDFKNFGYSADYSLWQNREEDGIKRLNALEELPDWVEDLSPDPEGAFYVIDREHFAKFRLFIREWKLEGANGKDDEDVPEPVSDETINAIVAKYQPRFNVRATKQYIDSGVIQGNNVVVNSETRRAFPATSTITLDELSQTYEIEVDSIKDLIKRAGFDSQSTLNPFQALIIFNRLLEGEDRKKPTDYVEFEGVSDSLLFDPVNDIDLLEYMKEKALIRDGTETEYGNIKHGDYRKIYEKLDREWAITMSDGTKGRKEIMGRLGYLEMPAIISELQRRGIRVDVARPAVLNAKSSIVLGTIHEDRVDALARQILNTER